MFKNKAKLVPIIILSLIIIFGGLIRFINIDTNPPSLNWDEVAIGYNAHSILMTGKDEFGISFPVYFRSFDDYKMPVYIYMSVISEMMFGYGEFAVRFFSAFFGTLTILIVYLISNKLFKNKTISILAALFFAIAPWHIQFSRMGAESIAGLFFLSVGMLTFLYGTEKRRWLFLISFFFFAISAYTYMSYRFIAPMLIGILIILNFKQFFKKSIFVYLTLLLIIIFGVVLGYDSYINRNTSRTAGILAVSSITNEYRQDIREMAYDGALGINIPRRIFHDSHIFSTIDIIGNNYFLHLSPSFIFFNKGHLRDYTPMTGLLYLWMLPFLFAGFYFLIRHYKKQSLTVLALILIFPIPAAFVFDSPNAIRTTALVLPFSILAAIGVYHLGKVIFKKNFIYFVIYLVAMSTVIAFSFYHFQHQNSIHLIQERSDSFQYGREGMTEYINEHKNEYDKVFVSTSLEWPHIFYLYYSKYDPKKYLEQGGTINGSWSSEKNKVDNIEFHRFDYPSDAKGEKVLFVGTPDDFSENAMPIYKIDYPNGEPAVYFLSN